MPMNIKKYEELTPAFQNKNKIMKMKTAAIAIKAGTLFELPLIISKPGTIINWNFKSKWYDIKFGVASGKAGSGRTFLVESASFLPDIDHKGSTTFSKAGTYYMVWDNTYSWMRGKDVEYSIEIIMPDLTLEEIVACSRTIMEDLKSMKNAIVECEQQKMVKKEEFENLEKQRIEKKEELEKINKEILRIEGQMQECETTSIELEQKKIDEEASIEKLFHFSPFLLEGERIFAMLSGSDLLRLGCSNHMLHAAVHSDKVWMRVFKQESKEQLQEVLKNEWLSTKYNLLSPAIIKPAASASEAVKPVEKAETAKEEAETAKEGNAASADVPKPNVVNASN